MQLTDLGPIDGFALSRLHARLSVVEADGPVRAALVTAARRLSPDGTVVLDPGLRSGGRGCRRHHPAPGRARPGRVCAPPRAPSRPPPARSASRPRWWSTAGPVWRSSRSSCSGSPRRAPRSSGRGPPSVPPSDDAARARAAVERVLAQRTEVDDAVRSVRERLANGEADDELEAQVAEVQRVLDQTEAERRARATDADLGVNARRVRTSAGRGRDAGAARADRRAGSRRCRAIPRGARRAAAQPCARC